MSGQIKTVGGLYEPEELALAYSEQRDFIAELTREKQRLEVSAESYDALVQALKPIVEDSARVYGEGGLDDRVSALEDSLQESDFDELSAKVDGLVGALRILKRALSDI